MCRVAVREANQRYHSQDPLRQQQRQLQQGEEPLVKAEEGDDGLDFEALLENLNDEQVHGDEGTEAGTLLLLLLLLLVVVVVIHR